MKSQPSRRIYRGPPSTPDDGIRCALCGREVKITATGTRRKHRAPNGDVCIGSGMRVHPREIDRAAVEAALAVPPPMPKPRNKWSGAQ